MISVSTFKITKVKEPIEINGMVLNDSIQGVRLEIRKRQSSLANLNRRPCTHNILERVSLQVEISKLIIIKQELILIQTMKIHSL